jgi:hypothetical protein
MNRRAGNARKRNCSDANVDSPTDQCRWPSNRVLPGKTIGDDKVAKDHGPSVKHDKQYEGLRKQGMSKTRAAKVTNSPGSSSRGGKKGGKKSS